MTGKPLTFVIGDLGPPLGPLCLGALQLLALAAPLAAAILVLAAARPPVLPAVPLLRLAAAQQQAAVPLADRLLVLLPSRAALILLRLALSV